MFATYGQREGASRAYADHGASLKQANTEVKSLDPKESLAPRVEAAMKALGTGWNHGVRWCDCEVVRKPGGRPTIQFHGKAGEFAAKLGVKNAALSISHTQEQAIAQVILEN